MKTLPAPAQAAGDRRAPLQQLHVLTLPTLLPSGHPSFPTRSAAGNSGDDTDVYPYYPGSFEFPGVVAVANVAPGDALAPSRCAAVSSVGSASFGWAVA